MNKKLRELIKKEICNKAMDLDESIEYVWELKQDGTRD